MPKVKSILEYHSQTDTAKVATANSAKSKSSPNLLQPKNIKQFKLTDIHFREESYFKGNKFFRPAEAVNRGGVLGDPKPYSTSSDNIITGLLIVCFMFAMIAISLSRNFIARQIRTLFKMPKDRKSDVETYGEMRFHVFLVAQTALLLSIIYYIYNNSVNGLEYSSSDLQIKVVGAYFAILVIYFIFKRLLYSIVNWVYFKKKDNQRWMQWWFFITSAEGMLLFPMVLLMVYFNLSMQIAVIYTLSVLLIIKLFTLQKQYAVFFSSNLGVQIILYFCALEMLPLTALVGTLKYVENFLKINF